MELRSKKQTRHICEKKGGHVHAPSTTDTIVSEIYVILKIQQKTCFEVFFGLWCLGQHHFLTVGNFDRNPHLGFVFPPTDSKCDGQLREGFLSDSD